jgi:HAE1 family hydrophobic/amphiphilic exporter-1
MQDIRTALYSAYGEKQVSTIYTPVNTYQVILEVTAKDKQFESDLSSIFLRGRATDKLVPLSSIATFNRFIGPTSVNHQGQIPAVTISFNTHRFWCRQTQIGQNRHQSKHIEHQ